MTTEELREQNGLADALLEKLERIKSLWAELPPTEKLSELTEAAGELSKELGDARGTFNNSDTSLPDFPTVEELTELTEAASGLNKELADAWGTFNNSDTSLPDFPTVDELTELTEAAGKLSKELAASRRD